MTNGDGTATATLQSRTGSELSRRACLATFQRSAHMLGVPRSLADAADALYNWSADFMNQALHELHDAESSGLDFDVDHLDRDITQFLRAATEAFSRSR